MNELRPDTLAVRGGLARSNFDETSEGLFLTSGYVPLEQGADVIVYSATKHIDGQGRSMGGAVLGTSEFINGPVKNLMRHTGPSMSPFNAWVLLKGLETLSLRVERMAASALELARALEAHPKVGRVIYPWLESHPQHDLAEKQMYGGGTVVTFERALG
jgi:O-succinylhomoserine sulfhydrylase